MVVDNINMYIYTGHLLNFVRYSIYLWPIYIPNMKTSNEDLGVVGGGGEGGEASKGTKASLPFLQ